METTILSTLVQVSGTFVPLHHPRPVCGANPQNVGVIVNSIHFIAFSQDFRMISIF